MEICYVDDDGNVEGFNTIDDGANGQYYFSGKLDVDTGELSLSEAIWVNNISGFSFSVFNGSISDDIYEGTLDNDSSRTFKLEKVSNETKHNALPASFPRDWDGEYDGNAGDGTKVRRNIEMHFDNVKETLIDGKAVITPSDKALKGYGATGSYKFNMNVYPHVGLVTYQGYEWIDYPVGEEKTGNWSFIYLAGFLDSDTGTIKGYSYKDDNSLWSSNNKDQTWGIWEMESINYAQMATDSELTLGKDNNLYSNSNIGLDAGFAGTQSYMLSDDFLNNQGASLSAGECAHLNNLMRREWDGSAYGIAAAMILTRENKLLYSDQSISFSEHGAPALNQEMKDFIILCDLNRSCLIDSSINGYRVFTFNNNKLDGLSGFKSSLMSYTSFLKTLIKEIGKNPGDVLLEISTANGGSALIAKGFSFNTETEQYEVSVYDPDSVNTTDPEGKLGTLFISKDFIDFTYTNPNGITYSNENWFGMNFVDFADNPLALTSDSRMSLCVPMGIPFKIEFENSYLESDGENLKGNIEIYDMRSYSTASHSCVEIITEKSERYTISGFSGEEPIEALTKKQSVAIYGTGMEKIVVSFKDGILIQGDQYHSLISLCNSGIKNEEQYLLLENEASGYSFITNDGVVLHEVQ